MGVEDLSVVVKRPEREADRLYCSLHIIRLIKSILGFVGDLKGGNHLEGLGII